MIKLHKNKGGVVQRHDFQMKIETDKEYQWFDIFMGASVLIVICATGGFLWGLRTPIVTYALQTEMLLSRTANLERQIRWLAKDAGFDTSKWPCINLQDPCVKVEFAVPEYFLPVSQNPQFNVPPEKKNEGRTLASLHLKYNK